MTAVSGRIKNFLSLKHNHLWNGFVYSITQHDIFKKVFPLVIPIKQYFKFAEQQRVNPDSISKYSSWDPGVWDQNHLLKCRPVFYWQLHITACEREKILLNFSINFLLSGLCSSVFFHPWINLYPTWTSSGFWAPLGRSIHVLDASRRLCGLGSFFFHWRKHTEVAKWLWAGGTHTHCLPALLCPGVCKMFDLKIMICHWWRLTDDRICADRRCHLSLLQSSWHIKVSDVGKSG